MSDDRRGHELTYTTPQGYDRRIIFEPRSEGGHFRRVFRDDGQGWEFVGREVVESLTVKTPD